MNEEGKNLGGRPTKLTDEMVDLAFKYLSDCSKEWEVREVPKDIVDYEYPEDDEVDEEGKHSTKPRKVERQDMVEIKAKPRLANRARLAYTLMVNQETMKLWTKPHDGDDERMTQLRKRFSAVLEALDDLQESVLIERGFDGESSSQVTNRILAAKYGYKEKVDSTTDGKALPAGGTTIIAAASDDLQKAVAAFEEALRPKRT